MPKIISEEAVTRRAYWIEELRKISGRFGDDSEKVEREIKTEIVDFGSTVVLDHLRLCGDIPESYGHDSSEEKLYSKYTDALLSESYKVLGLRGVFPWDRYGVEFPLQLLWTARTLYPLRFAKLDMVSETTRFYRDFFGYDLSPSDAARILAAKAPDSAP